MEPRQDEKAGPVTDFLVKDHGRLEALLQSAVAQAGSVDQGACDQFRAGLLRHIGMEEKILLPAAQRLRGGEPLSIAAKLRLDHGASRHCSCRLPRSPSLRRSVPSQGPQHNRRRPGGLYETYDELAALEAAQLLAKLQAAPELAVLPCSDSPAVMPAIQRALERAGYGFHEGTI